MNKIKNKGFTLLELIISIAILVILTGLLAPQAMRYIEKAQRAKIIQKFDSIHTALKAVYVDIPWAKRLGDGYNSVTVQYGIGKDDTGIEISSGLKTLLGEEELGKIDIYIEVQWTDGDSTGDLDDISNLIICYHENNTPDHYYFRQGYDGYDEPYSGIYGEIKNGKTVEW